MNTATNHWPCPNNCQFWARVFDPRQPMTLHHPRCEHVDESLIDVWSVRIPGEQHGCVVADEVVARSMAAEDPDAPLEVVPMKMHREVFENLPEHGGF